RLSSLLHSPPTLRSSDLAIARAERAELRVQEHGGRRTFVSTNAGYRLELHPPREWIDELLAQSGRLRLSELHLKADDPEAKAERSEEHTSELQSLAYLVC